MLSSNNKHSESNQENYKKDALTHSELGLNSTLYLAYRDIAPILQTYVFEQTPKKQYKLLDFGCGAGLSTEILSKIIVNSGYEVDIYGVDINEENLKFARLRVPKGKFQKIEKNTPIQGMGHFDIIVCNFVLLEHQYRDMVNILKLIQPMLSDTGILITTNCTGKLYNSSNKWYSFNCDFVENKPTETKGNKLKIKDDQPVKIQMFNHDTGRSFTFFDFFHSGNAYRTAYKEAGLDLAETLKPLGKQSDGLPWLSEKNYSPYKIHVLRNGDSRRKELTPALRAKL